MQFFFGMHVFFTAQMGRRFAPCAARQDAIEQIKMKIQVPVCTALVVVFGIDAAWSCISPNAGAGVTEGSGGKAQTEVTTGA